MRVWNGIERFPTELGPVCATVGNYDGVHLGHRAILDEVVARAARDDACGILVTFEPHPLSVVAPERRPDLIQTRRQKLVTLEATGLDGVLILPFTREFSKLGGRAFFEEVVCSVADLRAMFIGDNFRFGQDRAGDAELLRTIGAERGFDVIEVPPITIDGAMVSSSVIRRLIRDGDVEAAGVMLGRPYAVEGEVVRGEGRGRTLEFPTANLRNDNELLPRAGVYVSETILATARHPSVTNIGVRPTFGGPGLTFECHLLDFDDDLYGERVETRLLARLRDEQAFDSPTELSDQIARDLAAAESFFENVSLGEA